MSSDTNVTKYQIKEELRKQWAIEAVEMAMSGRWDEAVQANQHILEIFPEDTQSRNRLGKAFQELNRLEDALAAYEHSLQKQPSNNIARKRLAELYALLNREPTIQLGEGMPAVEISDDEADDADLEFMEDDDAESGGDDDAD
jgi:tetratricopeptide (TPR) repeat protein